MRSHYLILPILLGASLASVHLLPEAGEMASSAVNMDLPGRAGTWKMWPQAVSADEVAILAPDTRFAKAICLSPREGEVDIATGIRYPGPGGSFSRPIRA